MSSCQHENFEAHVKVNRMSDTGRFLADIHIKCAQCDEPFVFLGLPGGLNLDGAAVSAGATEARLAIAPLSRTQSPVAPATACGESAAAKLEAEHLAWFLDWDRRGRPVKVKGTTRYLPYQQPTELVGQIFTYDKPANSTDAEITVNLTNLKDIGL